MVNPDGLLNRKYPSIKTALNKTQFYINQVKEIHGDKYIHDKVVYLSARDYLIITCPNHGDFKINTTKHLERRGCPECGKETGGFSKSQIRSASKDGNAILYILKCWNKKEEFYKIGITGKSIKHRYNTKSQLPYPHETIYQHKDVVDNIWNLEKQLFRKYKEFKYKPQISFGGQTECFTASLPVKEIIIFLN